MVLISQILHFVLKHNHIFKSYQNVLTNLGFSFVYHKLQHCLYVMYNTPNLYLVKDS
jgi:hypothetical protein